MATVRVALAEAMRAIRSIAPGEGPSADEIELGLEAAQNLVQEIHEARGPMLNVDITAATWVPSENQRLRVQDTDTLTVTLPNSIPIFARYNPYDYGFTANGSLAPIGSLAPADGYSYRAPYDGVRIEIVGTTQGLYFYRDDTNAWVAADALTIDSELPLNARLTSAFSAMLAERIFDAVSDQPPTPMFTRRVRQARAMMFTQTGKARAETVGQYL